MRGRGLVRVAAQGGKGGGEEGQGAGLPVLTFAGNFINYQFQRQLSSERINKYINKRNT